MSTYIDCCQRKNESLLYGLPGEQIYVRVHNALKQYFSQAVHHNCFFVKKKDRLIVLSLFEVVDRLSAATKIECWLVFSK